MLAKITHILPQGESVQKINETLKFALLLFYLMGGIIYLWTKENIVLDLGLSDLFLDPSLFVSFALVNTLSIDLKKKISQKPGVSIVR